MARVYVAINGDDVGSAIGDAVASNDHMALNKLSTSLKDSHGMIEEWVANHGGEIITSNGDEGIYILPEESLDELEQIRSQYQQMSGHTVTVGIGNSMADASKALIYGKLNEKNQVVYYEPAIDDMLSEEDVEEAEEIGQENIDQGMPEAEQQDDGNLIQEGQQKQYLNEDQMNGATPATQPLDSGDTEDMADDDDNIESSANEVGEANDDDQQFEDDGSTDEYEQTNPDEAVDAVVSQEQGGEEMQNDENFDENADGVEDEATMDMDSDGDIDQDDDQLANMVEDDMTGDEDVAPMDDDMSMEDDQEMSMEEEMPADDHADLKGAIIETLQIFRTHKQDLDMLATANPELHHGLISMLQHMIEMGKRIQGSGQEETNDVEELNQFADEFPDAEDMDNDGDVDQDDADIANEEIDDQEDQEMIDEKMDEHNEKEHDEDPDEDSAITDDEEPDEDATPDDDEENGDEDDGDKKEKKQ